MYAIICLMCTLFHYTYYNISIQYRSFVLSLVDPHFLKWTVKIILYFAGIHNTCAAIKPFESLKYSLHYIL